MVNKFDVTKKKLTEAIPCLVMMIRDDGNIDWYENAKAGQLLQITTGEEKAYINLDNAKIKNFANDIEDINEMERDGEITELETKRIKEIRDKYEKETIKVKRKNKDGKEVEETLKMKDLMGQFVYLDRTKMRDMTKGAKKPVMGFVCYEKEFNAMPNFVLHDSKQVTSWMDYIIKNYKSFSAQKLEAITKFLLIGAAIVAIGVFAYFKYFAKDEAEAAAAATGTVNATTAPIPGETATIVSGLVPFAYSKRYR